MFKKILALLKSNNTKTVSLVNNPDFAEKLFGTLSVGPTTTPEEAELCKEIWRDCDNNRFEVLKKIVEICGNVDTPQARFIKAKAWTWNSTAYSKEAAEACESYLRGEIYSNLNEIKNGFIKGHLADFHVAAGKAYANYRVKDYKKSDMHFEAAIELSPKPQIYSIYAATLRQTKRHNQAVELLEKAQFKVDDEWLKFRTASQQLEIWNQLISKRLAEERRYRDNALKKADSGVIN